MKRFLFIITLILMAFAVIVIQSCKAKEEVEEIDCDEFCLYANLDNFHKTAPMINAYLEKLSKNNWSDERKLEALASWLNAIPCIDNAELSVASPYQPLSLRSTPLTPPRGSITVRLNENGTTSTLLLFVGKRYPYEYESWVAYGYQFEKPGEVSVAIQPFYDTGAVFDFINSFDFEVKWLYGLYYSSTRYSQDYMIDHSNKPYIAGVGTGSDTSFLLTFHSMHDKNHQADWLKFMADYHLFEAPLEAPHAIGVTFSVPRGKEKEWAVKFLSFDKYVISTSFNWEWQDM